MTIIYSSIIPRAIISRIKTVKTKIPITIFNFQLATMMDTKMISQDPLLPSILRNPFRSFQTHNTP
uniref:Uncharacterized protein n=1 Tax=Brassica oleracea var. oleracea TaxID=109376 RepID=A0A0D3CIG5_BRAOL